VTVVEPEIAAPQIVAPQVVAPQVVAPQVVAPQAGGFVAQVPPGAAPIACASGAASTTTGASPGASMRPNTCVT